MIELGGQTVVVTGAARGIGAAIAFRVAQRGAAVGVLDIAVNGAREVADTIADKGGQALAVQVDVTDEAAVTEAFDRVRDGLGPVTGLVNNAGTISNQPFGEMSVDDWDEVLSVNLRGAFLCSRIAYAQMTPRGAGRIVNLSSLSARGNRFQANYAAAKAGVEGLTRTLAVELGPHGITVNAVAPGIVITEMSTAVWRGMGVDPVAMEAEAAQANPVRRTGRPDDIAGIVSFLLSDDASYITGHTIVADGGRVLTFGL